MTDLSRWEELAADQALWGLDRDEFEELRSAMRDAGLENDTALRSWDDVAAAVTLECLGKPEPMPEHLRSRVAAACPLETPTAAPQDRTALAFPLPLLLAAALLVGLGVGFALDLGGAPVATTETAAAAFERVAGAQDAIRYPFAKGDSALVSDSAVEGAEVVWSDDLNQGVMRIRGLPRNDPQQSVYQLWIFDGGRIPEGGELLDQDPVDGGVFSVNANGEALIVCDPKLNVRKGTAFAITVEPPGGVVVSKREGLIALIATPPGN